MPTIAELQRAIQISEQIQNLEAELASILNGGAGERGGQPAKRGRPRKVSVNDGIEGRDGLVDRKVKKQGGMSAEGRAKIAAAQRARWAKAKGENAESTAAEPKAKKKKRKLSPEARARIVAAVKAR